MPKHLTETGNQSISGTLSASGNIEAATFTRAGVAQQNVGTGASPTFAGVTGTTGTFSGIVKAASGTNSSISYGVSGFSSGISIFSNEWTSLIGSGQYIASFSRGQNCRFRNDTGIGWTTQNASPSDTPDVAIRRYGVGELIINNGTNAATNPASLRLLNLTASGTITGSNLSGLNTGDETAARITALITTTAHKEALFAALGVPAFDTLAAANASGDITIGKPFYNRDVAVAGLDITTA